jgi:hypothetical protein
MHTRVAPAGLLGLGDGPHTTAVALLLLRRMASADARLARTLLELGGLQQLHTQPLQQPQQRALEAAADGETPHVHAPQQVWVEPGIWPPELVSSVEALACVMLGLEPPPALPAPAAATTAAGQGVPGGSPGAPGAPRLSRPHLASPSSVGGATVSPADDATDAGRTGGRRHGTPHAPGVAAMLAQQQHEQQQQRQAEDSTAVFDERVLRARARADWDQAAAAAATTPPPPQPPPPLLFAASSAAAGAPLFGHVSLRRPALSAADDQALFEVNVRLQYSDDERLLLPALLELGGGGLAADMPGEALLTRPSILVRRWAAPWVLAVGAWGVLCHAHLQRSDGTTPSGRTLQTHTHTHTHTHKRLVSIHGAQDNCLALVGSSKACRRVQGAAAEALRALLHSLKLSLALQHCPELAHSEFGDALAAAAAADTAGVPSAHLHAATRQQQQQQAGGLKGFAAAAAALAAAKAPLVDPSCPNSYPQLQMPADGVAAASAGAAAAGTAAVWRLLPPDVVLTGGVDERAAVVDVTAAVNSICLQVRACVGVCLLPHSCVPAWMCRRTLKPTFSHCMHACVCLCPWCIRAHVCMCVRAPSR